MLKSNPYKVVPTANRLWWCLTSTSISPSPGASCHSSLSGGSSASISSGTNSFPGALVVSLHVSLHYSLRRDPSLRERSLRESFFSLLSLRLLSSAPAFLFGCPSTWKSRRLLTLSSSGNLQNTDSIICPSVL